MIPRSHDRATTGISVSLSNEQSRHAVEESQLVSAVQAVLADSDFTSASISLAIVDDSTIHLLNQRYLEHDYPTDVLSFVLANRDGHLEGEIVLSADTASAEAAEIGWPAAAEQVLYAIHGALHMVGYGDKTPAETAAMRAAEDRYLRRFGIDQPTRPQSTDESGDSLSSECD